MRRSAAVVVSVVMGLLVALVVAPPATAAPYCGIRWGSLAKAAGPMSSAELVGVRSGRHPCFDRLVLDVAGGDVAGYTVGYVGQVSFDGSGQVVPLRGGARLEVVARVPATPTDAVFRPNGELVDVRDYRTFRHVAWAGSFEGQTTIGLGVRARLPFRVFVLDGPGGGSRLVVDVAHRW